MMGCCNKDKGCEKQQRERSIPWFSLMVVVLALLVLFNWQ
jgi:hypothetical protein